MAHRRKPSLLDECVRLLVLVLLLGSASATAFWESLTPAYRVLLVALIAGLVATGFSMLVVWSRYRRQQRELAWRKATAGLRRRERANAPENIPAMSFHSLTPQQLEHFTADLFHKMGWRAEHTGCSGDHGVDVRLVNPQGAVEVVQCKQHHQPVSEKAVRDLAGAMLHENAAQGYLVAPGGFSEPARRWAVGKPLVLVDERRLQEMVEQAYGDPQKPPAPLCGRKRRGMPG